MTVDTGRLVGQTVSGLSRTYGYDFQSRMTSLTDTNGSVFGYVFDGGGNRARQSLNDCLSTRFVYDGPNGMLEMSASNEVVWAWVNGPGMDQPVKRIAFIDGTARNRQVVHTDGLGSVSVLTDESGEPAQSYAYEAFGGIWAQTGHDLNRVTFTAREALGDSLGFTYYRHRVYDPNTGRFTSEDPLGFIDSPNRYAYVANNPVNWTDSLGLFKFGKRPLKKVPWIPVCSSNPIDDYFNTEISHEHGFFEDGSGDNIGFGEDGRFSENPDGKGYRYGNTHYDDALIREVLKNIQDGDDSKPKNNCQDWADRLRKEYERLKKERDGDDCK